MASDARHGEHHAGRILAERVQELVVEKLAEKAAAKKKESAKGRLQAEAIELLRDRIGAIDLWTRVPPGERKTLVTRDELAAAAVAIADADGLGALSMRRLAAEVGVGTMTLYHYVRNKDELLTLLVDTVLGEMVVPASVGLPDTWREALVVLAERTRATLLRHPWILDVTDEPPVGPNSLRHFDQSLAALASLDRPLADLVAIGALVDEYVFGYCLMNRNNEHGAVDATPALLGYLEALVETGAYPELARLVAADGVEGVWHEVYGALGDDARFRRNLDRLLDGIEAGLARG